jgi:hypothetical protein
MRWADDGRGELRLFISRTDDVLGGDLGARVREKGVVPGGRFGERDPAHRLVVYRRRADLDVLARSPYPHAARGGILLVEAEERLREWIKTLAARRTDGAVFVVSRVQQRVVQRLRTLNVPLVAVAPVGLSSEEVPSIGCTNWAGGFSATGTCWSWGTAGPR